MAPGPMPGGMSGEVAASGGYQGGNASNITNEGVQAASSAKQLQKSFQDMENKGKQLQQNMNGTMDALARGGDTFTKKMLSLVKSITSGNANDMIGSLMDMFTMFYDLDTMLKPIVDLCKPFNAMLQVIAGSMEKDLIPLFKELADKFKDPEFIARLQQLGKDLGDMLLTVAQNLPAFMDFISNLDAFIKDVIALGKSFSFGLSNSLGGGGLETGTGQHIGGGTGGTGHGGTVGVWTVGGNSTTINIHAGVSLPGVHTAISTLTRSAYNWKL